MPFGLCNAPGVFQRIMNTVLSPVLWRLAMVYIDDVIVFSKTEEEHVEALEEVMSLLVSKGLTIRLKKCQFFKEEVQFLGHVLDGKGIRPQQAKVDAIQKVRVPSTRTHVRSFLGMVAYYRKFIKNFASIAAPLHSLTGKNTKFAWTEGCQKSFETLKKKLMEAPILAHPNF